MRCSGGVVVACYADTPRWLLPAAAVFPPSLVTHLVSCLNCCCAHSAGSNARPVLDIVDRTGSCVNFPSSDLTALHIRGTVAFRPCTRTVSSTLGRKCLRPTVDLTQRYQLLVMSWSATSFQSMEENVIPSSLLEMRKHRLLICRD